MTGDKKVENLSRQSRIYFIFNFINRFMVYMPVFVLFFKEKGLSQVHIMMIMSAYNISVMVAEIPTGVIADKISRKTSIMIGSVVQGLSMFCMAFSANFPVLIVIEIVFGIGLTFQSGAMSAMFYDYLKEIGREELYPDLEGKRWACVFASQAIASILGGVLAEYNIASTLVLTAIAYCLSAVVLLGFKEVKVKREKKFVYTEHIAETIKYMLGVKKVVIMLLIIVLTEIIFSTTLWLYQPYYQVIGIEVSAYGVAYFLMNAVSALGGSLSGRVNLSMKKAYVLYILGNAFFTGLMGIVGGKIGLIIPSFVFFVNGFLNSWIRSFWENDMDSTKRATAGSIQNLLTSLGFAIVAIPVGYVSDTAGVQMAFGVSTIGYIFMIAAVYVGSRILKREIR